MTDTSNTGQSNDTGQGEGQGTNSEDTGQQSQETSKTLTQAEVDVIVRDRLKREREKFKDYDTLKEQASKWSTLEEAQKTELDKAREGLTKAEQAASAAVARANNALRKAGVVGAASELGAIKPEAVFKLLNIDDIEIDDEGNVTNARQLVEDLLKEMPFLKGTRASNMGTLAAGATGGLALYTRDQIADRKFYLEHKDDILAAQKEGRIQG